MLERLSYKHKNYLLVAGLLILGVVVWKSAIRKTLDVRAECENLQIQLAKSQDAPAQLAFFRQRLSDLDALVGKGGAEASLAQQELLERVSDYCTEHRMTLKAFPESHEYTENEYAIVTNKVEVEGDFVDLVKLVYELEQKYTAARISSTQFYSKKNLKTKKVKLYALIYFQNIKRV